MAQRAIHHGPEEAVLVIAALCLIRLRRDRSTGRPRNRWSYTHNDSQANSTPCRFNATSLRCSHPRRPWMMAEKTMRNGTKTASRGLSSLRRQSLNDCSIMPDQLTPNPCRKILATRRDWQASAAGLDFLLGCRNNYRGNTRNDLRTHQQITIATCQSIANSGTIQAQLS